MAKLKDPKVAKGNKIKVGYITFDVINYSILGILALSCVLPLLHVLAISLSGSIPAQAGQVYFWPVKFNLESYKFILQSSRVPQAFWISIQRMALGLTSNLFLIIISAYPLSKENDEFRGRTFITWIFFFTSLFGGGLIPSYMTIRDLGLLDNLWVLVLPSAFQVFNVVLLLNFFRQLPKGVEEAAFIDGAGYFTTLWKVFVPMSLPSLATIALFSAVGHWNAWFDGIIYMNRTELYPLSSYLQTVIQAGTSTLINKAGPEMASLLEKINDSTLKSAQIFIGALPIISVYPFLQRFFMKGIVIGSVKG